VARHARFRVGDVKRGCCRDTANSEVVCCSTRELKLVNVSYICERNSQGVIRYFYGVVRDLQYPEKTI